MLCPMPFFVMIVLNRNDISDCLLCLPMGVAGLLVLGRIWKDHKDSGKSGAGGSKRLDKI